MDNDQLANQLSDLASTAERLANEVYLDEDVPDERTRYLTHELRETLGVALILAERLAQRNWNGRMVTLDGESDGTARVCYEVALDETEIIDMEAQ